jgi:cobyrinic acid a,c-diamide synthase
MSVEMAHEPTSVDYGYLLPVLLVIGDRASVSSRFDGVYCAPVVSVPAFARTSSSATATATPTTNADGVITIAGYVVNPVGDEELSLVVTSQ